MSPVPLLEIDLSSSSFWIIAALIVFAALLVIYIIASVRQNNIIVKTIGQNHTDFTKGDLLYYLPSYYLQLTAKAKVIIKKKAEPAEIIDAVLAELSFQTTVQIVPDTSCPFVVKYEGSSFSNDNLHFTINESGLLEGVNLTAEDRITNMVSNLADAPKIIMSGEKAAANEAVREVLESEDNVLYNFEMKEFESIFYVLADEITNGGSLTRTWKINIDGTAKEATTADASFKLTFAIPDSTAGWAVNSVTTTDGFLVRPKQILTIKVEKTAGITSAFSYQVVVPNIKVAVPLLIKRAAFVKKTYEMKFSNGMLTENKIDKPSQAEGLASIPVKIAKAIVSIPAHLIQLKIVNIKNETSLETQRQLLKKAQLDTRKNEIGLEAELLKAKLESQKAMLTYDSDIAKTKLEAEKSLFDAQKNNFISSKALADEQKNWEKAKKELSDYLQQIKDEKKKP